MKSRNFLLILSFILLLVSCQSGNKPAEDKHSGDTAAPESLTGAKHKYSIKSGIVEYNAITMGTALTQTMYFDDYGAKEATELEMEMAGIKSHTRNIITGDYIINLDLNTKTGTKAKITNPLGNNIDFENLTEAVKKQMNIEKTGTEEYNGKSCDKYTIDYKEMQMKGTFLVWKGIAIKSELYLSTMKTTMEAKSIQENVAVPADKFIVPAGFQVTGN